MAGATLGSILRLPKYSYSKGCLFEQDLQQEAILWQIQIVVQAVLPLDA